MRLLIDTNVFIDYFVQNNNYSLIRNLFLLCDEQNHEIYVSTMTIRDTGYILQKYLHDKDKCRLVQNKIYQMANKIVPVSADAMIETLYSDYSDFEDGLIIEAAAESMCDAIVTSDTSGFKKSSIPAYSLDEINQRLLKLHPYKDR